MKTLFEIEIARDIGDIESGMLVTTCNDYYDCKVNLSQPIKKLFKEVEKRYLSECGDGDIIGVNVKRAVPESEANDIRRDMYDFDNVGYSEIWN